MPRKKNGSSASRRTYPETAQEYESLMEQLGLNQAQTARMFDFSSRTSRRYKSGEVEVPPSTLKLMRMMARGMISKRQVKRA
jgi:hypothetical protein